MSRSSIRRRLIGWLLLSTAVLGALALLDTWREAVQTATSVSDRVLAGSTLAIAERVAVDASGALTVDIPYSALEMLTSTAQDQVFYRVDGPGGILITGYGDLTSLPDSGDGVGFADSRFRGTDIRVATLHREATTEFGQLPFVVTVAESTLARDLLSQSILWRSALRLLGMILGAASIVWIVVTLALRPLNRLGAAIALRSSDDLSPIREETPAEVEGILQATNSLMGRLDSAIAALRNFTGNASHQLRTPLAVVRTQLALAARTGDPASAQESVQKADAALARAERVLAQLLLLARVDTAAGRDGFQRLDLTGLARAITAEMVPNAARAGVDLGFSGEGAAQIAAEPILFTELLRNLLDNAIAYAGQGAEVTVFVRQEAGVVVLGVEDNGPGLPAERLGKVPTRHLAPANPGGTGQGGYGLGLAIVSEIATLFSGVLALKVPDSGKGLLAELRFPL